MCGHHTPCVVMLLLLALSFLIEHVIAYPGQSNTHTLSFAALHADGKIATWGMYDENATDFMNSAPSGADFTSIHTNDRAFAALRSNGSVAVWGDPRWGGSTPPQDAGYVDISSTSSAFAARHSSGKIAVWGNAKCGGIGAPSDIGYIFIANTRRAFAALDNEGTIKVWGGGLEERGIRGDSRDSGLEFANRVYVYVKGNRDSFAAIDSNGCVHALGVFSTDTPTVCGFVLIESTWQAFAALHDTGAISSWGYEMQGGAGYVRFARTHKTCETPILWIDSRFV